MRALAASPSSPDTWISGSYDHTVRMWDSRQPKGSVLELSHGAPVEACLFLPGGGLCVSAGGNEVKVSRGVGGKERGVALGVFIRMAVFSHGMHLERGGWETGEMSSHFVLKMARCGRRFFEGVLQAP